MEISGIQERYLSQVDIPIRIKSNSSSTVCLCSSYDTLQMSVFKTLYLIINSLLFSIHNLENISVADAGFPVGGSPSRWGTPTSNAGAFWQKCMRK